MRCARGDSDHGQAPSPPEPDPRPPASCRTPCASPSSPPRRRRLSAAELDSLVLGDDTELEPLGGTQVPARDGLADLPARVAIRRAVAHDAVDDGRADFGVDGLRVGLYLRELFAELLLRER